MEHHVILPMEVTEAHPKHWNIGAIRMPVFSSISATSPVYHIRVSQFLLLQQPRALFPEQQAS